MWKLLKIVLRILFILIALVVLAFAGSWFYLKQHKKELISFIEMEAEKSLNGGTLHIGDITLGFQHTFPLVSLTMDSIYLRDSHWRQHHHDFVSANRIYATIDMSQLLHKKITIQRIELDKPDIYLYTDSLGYSNTSIFKKKENPSHKKDTAKTWTFPVLEVSDGSLSVDNGGTHKFFGFHLRKLECNIQEKPESPIMVIDLKLNCLIRRMTFNREKGPFLENKNVGGDFRIRFNKESGDLHFANIRLDVDQQPFIFTGNFLFAQPGTPFILSWETKNLPFRKAVSFLSTNLKKTLATFDISDSITHLTGSLDNYETQYSTPWIHLWLTVQNKTITSPFVVIQNASFTASYNNVDVKNKGHEDSNTVIHFFNLNGRFENMDFCADSLLISNIINPKIKVKLASDFPLKWMNNYLDSNKLAFSGGTGKIDLTYMGSLDKKPDSSRILNGSISLDSGILNFVSRNLQFNRVSGAFRLTGKDLIVDNLLLHADSSDLNLNLKVKSMFYLFNHQNNMPALEWSIHSDKLNLDDFKAFLQKKKKPAATVNKKSLLAQAITDFTHILIRDTVHFGLNVNRVTYKKFIADSVNADVLITDHYLQLKNIRMQHGGGSLALNAVIRNDSAGNAFSCEALVNTVNTSRFFYAFNNFGLKSPTYQNIHGNLIADINMNGFLTSNANLIPDSLRCFVKFSIQNGDLVNFEPMMEIGKKIFKKRNFSDIHFADLHDLLEIRGENVTLNRMEIRSSVLGLFAEGNYDLKTGPDLSVQVPLSNLKEIKDSVLVDKGINSKTGVSVRLWVKTGEDGKMKISWDPFNKAAKEKKKKKSTD